MLCLLDSNGGMRVAAAWRLCQCLTSLISLTSLSSLTSWCAIVYPEGLHAVVWYGSGEELPQRHAAVTAARLENPPAAPGVVRGHSSPLTGRATHPTATRLFFAKLFFHLEKKAAQLGLVLP